MDCSTTTGANRARGRLASTTASPSSVERTSPSSGPTGPLSRSSSTNWEGDPMDKTISVSLSGHDEQFRLEEAGYDRLARYLTRAETRLQDDPDRAEVVRDLERSIGDRLASSAGPPDRLISAAEIDEVLDAIGAVDTGRTSEIDDGAPQVARRRLMRITEGQQIAGVCNGLAAYSQIRVDWVRTIFVFATLLTAGLFLIVYIAMAFILPVAETRDAAG